MSVKKLLVTALFIVFLALLIINFFPASAEQRVVEVTLEAY
jgi:hypothetical protein